MNYVKVKFSWKFQNPFCKSLLLVCIFHIRCRLQSQSCICKQDKLCSCVWIRMLDLIITNNELTTKVSSYLQEYTDYIYNTIQILVNLSRSVLLVKIKIKTLSENICYCLYTWTILEQWLKLYSSVVFKLVVL